MSTYSRTRNSIFQPSKNQIYIALNKPYGVLSQFTQPEGSNKKSLAEFGLPAQVYPVGRLDLDSEGLLLLTDDRRLNQLLLNPTQHHPRTYLAQVENIPTESQLIQIKTGVLIQGRKSLPALVRLLPSEPEMPPRSVPIRLRKEIPTSWIELTITEGRNRQVRHMTAAIGCPTLRLVRVAIGQLMLSDLGITPGQWIKLSHQQLTLVMAVG